MWPACKSATSGIFSAALLHAKPHVLTAEQICEHAWGMEYTQPVDRAIHELRKQIEPDPAYPRYIKTVYRVGYRFTAYRSEIEKVAAL